MGGTEKRRSFAAGEVFRAIYRESVEIYLKKLDNEQTGRFGRIMVTADSRTDTG